MGDRIADLQAMREPDAPYQDQTIVLDVPSGYDSRQRLDVYITSFVENASRSKVAQAIKEERVTVNGAPAKPSYVVQANDRIECRIRRPPPPELIPEDLPIDILYEDEVLIVVDKPAGMVVHPAFGHRSGTLVNALLHHVGYEASERDTGLSQLGDGPRFPGDPTVRPGLVHRLDKDTSGILVVAKSDAAHSKLARQLSARTMKRLYSAILIGVPSPAEGRVETHVGRDPRDRKRMAVVDEPGGKRAVTHFRTTEPLGAASLVNFRLETGRTHQIRVHAAHIGHPVLGDETYGGRSTGRFQKGTSSRRLLEDCLRIIDRQALHARMLGFRHPSRGNFLHFESPLPDDMQEVLDTMRKRFDR